MICVQPILQLFRKQLLHSRAVQAPDFHRVEPKLALTRGAEVDGFRTGGGGVGLGAGAVVPKRDSVKVLEVESGFRLLQGCAEDGAVNVGAGD